ncbi:PAAR domain-containing protein [Achromobacter sp. NPDC058515]|uniref:PAAR domain-containing protein n=1 Tax=Achromobacter sp. NPDC058515 TaxID=3346533 RepID=UPI0036520BFF
MIGRPIIRVGDGTSHGGIVVQSFPFYTVNGRQAAGVGHMATCPTCEGAFPIVEGVSNFTVDGVSVAVEGMKTACGATLIASQQIAVIDPGPGGIAWTGSDSGSLASGLVGGAGTNQPLSQGLLQEDCDHSDTAVPLAEYIVREMKTNPFSVEGRKIAAANTADPQARLAE